MFAKYISNNIYIFGLNNKNYTMTLNDVKGSSFEKKIFRYETLSSSIIHKFKTDKTPVVYIIDEFNMMNFNKDLFVLRM